LPEGRRWYRKKVDSGRETEKSKKRCGEKSNREQNSSYAGNKRDTEKGRVWFIMVTSTVSGVNMKQGGAMVEKRN